MPRWTAKLPRAGGLGCCRLVVGGGWWVGCGCCLRIAQWTRASSATVDVCVGSCCCGQVAEGGWWMPWHQEPMKDVGGRDRPGGAVNRAVIPGCPNGETRHQSCGVTRT